MDKIFKYGCIVVLGLGLILLISVPILFKLAFGPLEETIIIKQQVGGELLCESTYTGDIQSWYYFIEYKYRNENGEVIDIGNGSYFGRDWEKNDQLIRIGEWLILKTGNEDRSDKLLIGKSDNQEWESFEISPLEIHKAPLWIGQKIAVKKNSAYNKSFVKKIDNKSIVVEYTFMANGGIEVELTKELTYKLNEETGQLKLVKIK